MYLAPDVFVLPTVDPSVHIVFAPLLGIAAAVNPAMAKLLAEIKSAASSQVTSSLPGVSALCQLGLLSEFPFPDLGPSRRSRSFAPTHVTLFPTNACNLNCSYCHASANDGPRLSLPWKIAQAAMDLVIQNALRQSRNVVGLTFHGGGEPSLEWQLLQDGVAYFREQAGRSRLRAAIALATNGVMSADHAHWIAKNCDSLTLSLDGLPESHNTFRATPTGQPTYDNVIRTAKIFDSVGVDYGIRMTVSHFWVEELPEAIQHTFHLLKVREIQVEPLSVSGRAGRSTLLAPDACQFIQAFRRADDVAYRFHRRLRYSGARLGIVTDRFCQGVGQSFAITPAGDVSCCYEMTDRSHPLRRPYFWGHFNAKTACFHFDEEARGAQLMWAVGHRSRCQECFCKWTCAGDCPMKREPSEEPGDAYGGYRCTITRALTQDQLVRAVRDGKGLALAAHPSADKACP